MPLPLLIPAVLLGGAAVAGGLGLKKTYDAKKKLDNIKEIEEYIKKRDKRTVKEFKSAREVLLNSVSRSKIITRKVYEEKLPLLFKSISKIKNINGSVKKNELKPIDFNLEKVKNEIMELKDFFAGVGVAVTTGVVTGAISQYGIATFIMSVGTASTGTALSSLSGAAATNAFLAFLGGGSLAAGGGGMALGSIVLGGITVAPAILIGGLVIDKMMEGKLEDAKQKLSEAEKVFAAREAGIKFYKQLTKLVNEYTNLMETFSKVVDKEILRIEKIIQKYGIDALNYDKSTMEEIRKSFKVLSIGAQLGHLDILNKKGLINKDFEIRLEQYSKSIKELLV